MPRLLACALVVLSCLLLFVGSARAEGRFDGKWSFSGIGESYTVQQWYKGCGAPPVGGGSGGGTVNVVTDGDELVIMAGRVFRTNQCWDPMPTLVREAHSRDAAGGSWVTRCVTPAGDPRRATITTTVRAVTDDKIVIQENGRYEITIAEGTCVADVHRNGVLNRIKSPDAPASASAVPSATTAPTPTPTLPPPPPAPTVDCSSPGEPARLEVRPSHKSLRPGDTFAFRAVVSDSAGCPTRTQTTWAISGTAAGGATIDAAGKVTIPNDAPEGSFDVVVTAAGKSTRVTVDVTTPAKYDELLAQGQTEKDEPSVAVIATGSIGGAKSKAEDNSWKRRAAFIAVVGVLVLGLGAVALFALRRSRRAAALEREAEERHAARMRDYEERKRAREAQHAAQMQAHIDSVKRAQEAAAAASTPHPGEMVCPACRAEFPPGSAFCPNDANRLIPLSGHEDVLTGPAGGICPVCHRGFNPGVKTCPYDREELVPYAMMAARPAAAPASKGKICPTCGGRFDGSAAFCGKDGTALVLLN